MIVFWGLQKIKSISRYRLSINHSLQCSLWQKSGSMSNWSIRELFNPDSIMLHPQGCREYWHEQLEWGTSMWNPTKRWSPHLLLGMLDIVNPDGPHQCGNHNKSWSLHLFLNMEMNGSDWPNLMVGTRRNTHLLFGSFIQISFLI